MIRVNAFIYYIHEFLLLRYCKFFSFIDLCFGMSFSWENCSVISGGTIAS